MLFVKNSSTAEDMLASEYLYIDNEIFLFNKLSHPWFLYYLEKLQCFGSIKKHLFNKVFLIFQLCTASLAMKTFTWIFRGFLENKNRTIFLCVQNYDHFLSRWLCMF
jgi:hypothetical protein